MLDVTWNECEAEVFLRGMKSVATHGGRVDLEPIDIEILAATAKHILHHDFDIGALAPITGEEILASIDEDHERRQLMQFAVLMPYAPGAIDPARVAVVDGYAAALGIEPQTLKDLRDVRDKELTLLRLDYYRRQINDIVKGDSVFERAVNFVAHQIDAKFGDEDLAERYRALEKLPDGTLGHTLFHHFRERGFPLPGEVGGMSEMLMPHDLCHVIGGFNTDMKGEISVAGFEAAMSRTEAGYDVLLSVLLNFHLGIRFTYEAERGHLDPDDLMEGFARGAPVQVDILTDWDWWPHLGRDLLELREALLVNGVPEVRMPPPRVA